MRTSYAESEESHAPAAREHPLTPETPAPHPAVLLLLTPHGSATTPWTLLTHATGLLPTPIGPFRIRTR
ncbi:hypothetical protein ACWCXC_23375 [Streptomyces sp. NPDC001515]